MAHGEDMTRRGSIIWANHAKIRRITLWLHASHAIRQRMSQPERDGLWEFAPMLCPFLVPT